jgi:hypothetical protein
MYLSELPPAKLLHRATLSRLLVDAADAARSRASAAQPTIKEQAKHSMICMHHLFGLPAAQNLGSDMLVQPLQLAAYLQLEHCMQRLCSLPGAQELDSKVLASAMQASVDKGDHDVLRHLCMLPAAKQLDSDMLGPLLLAAAKMGRHSCVRHLCMLPAVKQLDAGVIQQVLCAAEQRGVVFASRSTPVEPDAG